MEEEPMMKYCPHIECGGKLQPHTYDDGIGALDCDGPCSPRRVQMWRDKQATKEATPTWADKLGRMYVLPDWTYVCLETGLTDCAFDHCSMHGWKP